MTNHRRRECNYKKLGFKTGQFTEVVFLTLLLKGPSYGYKLIEEAINYGVDPDILTSGMAYKILRRLEQTGFVSSSWEFQFSEKPKRIYTITSLGKSYLFRWSKEAKRMQEHITKITNEIEMELSTTQE